MNSGCVMPGQVADDRPAVLVGLDHRRGFAAGGGCVFGRVLAQLELPDASRASRRSTQNRANRLGDVVGERAPRRPRG